MTEPAPDPKLAELAAVNRTIASQLERRTFLLDALGLLYDADMDASVAAAPLLLDERVIGLTDVSVTVDGARRIGREVYFNEHRASTGDNMLIQYQDDTEAWVEFVE